MQQEKDKDEKHKADKQQKVCPTCERNTCSQTAVGSGPPAGGLSKQNVSIMYYVLCIITLIHYYDNDYYMYALVTVV